VKALEVERDVQENQERRTRELAPPKCFQYQAILRFGMPSFRAGEGVGSTVTTFSKNIGASRDTWRRVGGFS